MAPPSSGSPSWRIGRGMTWRGPALVGGAVALGLLLFLLLWWQQRDAGFYRAPATPAAPAGQRFEPLPAPLPAGESGNASGMGAQEAETARARPPAPPRVAPPARGEAPAAAPVAAAGSDPVPISMPSPRYPPAALRNREAGTVLLRVEVGADGVPTGVAVLRSSRSRLLDRAASEAVRDWRFRPGQRDGQPVPGVVQVPINFDLKD